METKIKAQENARESRFTVWNPSQVSVWLSETGSSGIKMEFGPKRNVSVYGVRQFSYYTFAVLQETGVEAKEAHKLELVDMKGNKRGITLTPAEPGYRMRSIEVHLKAGLLMFRSATKDELAGLVRDREKPQATSVPNLLVARNYAAALSSIKDEAFVVEVVPHNQADEIELYFHDVSQAVGRVNFIGVDALPSRLVVSIRGHKRFSGNREKRIEIVPGEGSRVTLKDLTCLNIAGSTNGVGITVVG